MTLFPPRRRAAVPAPRPQRRAAERRLEVQLHPADIRKRVRYLFLSRRQVLAVGTGVAGWLALLATAAFITPEVVRGLARVGEYRALEAERERQGERVRALVGRLEDLDDRSAELRLKVDKIYLAYGLSSSESIGQGGFPPPPRPVPRSVYANVVQQGLVLEADIGSGLAVIGAFLGEVREFEDAHRERVRTTPSACPLTGDRFVLTSPFGNRRSPFTKNIDFHSGVDFAAPAGTEIRAPSDGTVVFAGRYPLRNSVGWWRYGNLVVLAHDDQFRTLFGHCDQVRVRRGQVVRQGELLATVGNTGWSTSPHLHYEVRRRNGEGEFEPVDPRVYILDRRWRDEERLLVRARQAPDLATYEPLPPLLAAD
jgi:murein DD-endopeptidase MepM/ murein hydrolase activator NlpD